MEILEIIEALEEKIEHSFTIPFIGRGIIDKDTLLDLLQEARIKYPEEMKQAKWVKDERSRIIADAQKEAAAIIKGAEEKIAAMVTEHEITKQATANANDIISKAQKDGREIKLAAIKFADELLERVENDVKAMSDKLRQGRENLRQ